jgi:thiamine-phosphate pyrophosphorylase
MHSFFFKKYYFVNTFDANLIKSQDKNTFIIYRNYNNKNYINEITQLKNICRKYKFKLILANNIKLALKLGLDGAYIPSFNNDFKHLSYSLKSNFVLMGSAHNLKEIKIKEKQRVGKILLSSLFKKNKNYLGINKFKNITKNFNKEFVALGGISKNNLKKLKLLNLKEFAGIGFFSKKKAP